MFVSSRRNKTPTRSLAPSTDTRVRLSIVHSALCSPLKHTQHKLEAPLSLQRLTPVDRQRYPPAPQHCCFYLMPLSSSSRAHPSCRHQSRRGRTSRARGRGRTTVWTQHAIHTEQRACNVSEKKARQIMMAALHARLTMPDASSASIPSTI